MCSGFGMLTAGSLQMLQVAKGPAIAFHTSLGLTSSTRRQLYHWAHSVGLCLETDAPKMIVLDFG